jgi:hypothetical protein
MSERWPAAALVEALRGRRVVQASCDGEGMDDVWLRLDDGTKITIDATLEEQGEIGGVQVGPVGRLVVNIGGEDLWPEPETR